MNRSLQFDYTTVGHVTIDVLAGGERRVGGSAFYSALQAARLGQRTRILTQGVPGEIERLLEPYRGELELTVIPAPRTTTLATAGFGAGRTQRMLAWAGPMPEGLTVDSAIVHLAPVARETPARWGGSPAFVGLTPQGLARWWTDDGGEVSLGAPDPAADDVADRCDAIVLNDRERHWCGRLLARAGAAGAVVAVTAEERPTTILLDGRAVHELAVAPVEDPREDLGAGDVFAAAFFVALAGEESPERAARFGTAAAAVRMQGSGPAAIAGRQAIDARRAASGRPA